MKVTPGPPLLEYAAPKAFFDGAYRYRSWNGVVSTVASAAVGAGMLFVRHIMFARGVAGAGHHLWWAAQVVGVLGAAMLLCAACGLVFVLQGRERIVRVTEHGITHGRRHSPWVRIARFGGMKHSNGVGITFELRGRGHFRQTLVTTPMLTLEQFLALADSVEAFARETKTDLLVVKEPEVPPSD
jgi:hypothetical protein